MKKRNRMFLKLLGGTSILSLAFLAGSYYLSQNQLSTATETQSEQAITYPDGPNGPFNWFYEKMADENGIVNYEAQHEAIEKTIAMQYQEANSFQEKLNKMKWEFKGPTNVGGRVVDISGDDNNPNKFYVGSASGGVYKTTDGGKSFTAIFDSIPVKGIGAVQVDPTDSDILYVGTGEANPGGGSIAYGGKGVWKTTDGGDTWTFLGLENSGTIGRIRVNPKNPQVVMVAVAGHLFKNTKDRGIYRSEDGGNTWKKTLFVSETAGGIDLDINPDNPDIVIASTWDRYRRPDKRKYGGPGSAVWRSTDGGKSFSKISSGLPSGEHGRIGVAIAYSDPKIVYTIYSNVSGSFSGLYKSTNGGESFTKTTANLQGACSGYCWWFGRIHVNTHDPDDIWQDGVGKYRSTDGGQKFNSANAGHADHHAMWFPRSKEGYVVEGNDGGIYISTNGGSSFKFIPMPITQFYAIDVEDKSGSLYGGTQDNGTQKSTGSKSGYKSILGGDGMIVQVDPNDPANTWYAESQWGGLTRNGKSITSGLSGRKNWAMPYTFDPTRNGKGKTVMYVGTTKIYRSTNSGDRWTSVSKDLTKGSDGKGGVKFGTITTIDVADSDKNIIYAGTDDGHFWVSKDYAKSWQKITKGLAKDRWVTRVTVDPKNPGTVYAAQSGYRSDDHTAYLFRSRDFGQTWENISSNLPGATVNDILVHPDSKDRLFAGTDTGVFTSENGGESWGVLGEGLPSGVIIHDLKMTNVGKNIYAGSFGRGIYKLSLSY